MNIDDIRRAKDGGEIDGDMESTLRLVVSNMSQLPADHPARKIVESMRVQNKGVLLDGQSPASQKFENLPGLAERPGLKWLLEEIHTNSIANMSPKELSRAETGVQVVSMARSLSQPVLRESINDVWPVLEEVLRHEEGADPKEYLIFDETFGPTLGAQSADETRFLLRSVLGQTVTAKTFEWAKELQGEKKEEVDEANALLRIRDINIRRAMSNGFGSGLKDTINILHILSEQLMQKHGRSYFTEEKKKRILEEHHLLMQGLSSMNLGSLSKLEHVVWPQSLISPRYEILVNDLRGKYGFGKESISLALSCPFKPEFFEYRELQDGTPYLDVNQKAYTPTILSIISQGNIRLGCPAMGKVMENFNRMVGETYFRTALPMLAKEC